MGSSSFGIDSSFVLSGFRSIVLSTEGDSSFVLSGLRSIGISTEGDSFFGTPETGEIALSVLRNMRRSVG